MSASQDGLWSAQEVRTQSAQVTGQLDVWDCLQEPAAVWVALQDVCTEHGADCTSLLCVL